MASSGNPNQPGGGQFMDVHKLFNPQSPNPSAPQNPNPSSSYPTPSLTYPPPPSASYPPPSSPYPFHQYPPHQMTNLPHQRSLPYPTPPQQPNPNAAGATLMALLTPPTETQHPIHRVNTPPTLFPNNNTNLPPPQALYPNNTTNQPPFPNISTNPPLFSNNSTSPLPPSSPMMRLPSSKLPKGRHLIGDRAVYDIDVRMEGEVQPQLEVTPITKYVSDPGLVLGRQIAVNKTYICYGLKMGAIRVLDINSAQRSLLKGLTQRVTDMAFFAEDVHLLASASVDGRIYVWRITEGPDEENKAQITEKIIIAIQIVGEEESVHPRVCWHCHKQEVLVIGIGRSVLRIDTTKVGKTKVNSAEEPLKFAIDNLIDGVQLVGKHEGKVTDLSMCQWMTSRLVSASTDGTIKIWEDRKAQPLLVLKPHDGQPVNSVTFLTAPTRPEHIILITGGPLNREIKIWVSGSEEGWLLPSDAESWHCTQTLDFKSSASRVEDSFFNQVVALPQAGLLLLANAKKNAIYAVHLDYGANPTATRMDYVAEFTVTMPILSFTGTSDLLPHGEHLVQVFCVQTHAIQQYALDLSQCLPPPIENVVLKKSDSVILRDSIDSEGFASLEQPLLKPVEMSLTSSAPRQSAHGIGSEPVTMSMHPPSSTSMVTAISADSSTLNLESKPISLSAISSSSDISYAVSSPLPLSPRLSEKFSGLRSPANGSGSVQVSDDRGGDKQVREISVDRQMDNTCVSDVSPVEDDSRSNENRFVRGDSSSVHNQPGKFKHPTHLVTPSEILMATTSSDTSNVIEHMSEGDPKVPDVNVNSDEQNVEMDVKVVGETEFRQGKDIGSHGELPSLALENKEKVFCSQASDLGMEMARECSALTSETYPLQESSSLDRNNVNEALTQASNVDGKVHDTTENTLNEGLERPAAVVQQVTPTTKGKKQKSKNTLASCSSSAALSAFNSAELTNDLAVTPRISSTDQNIPQNMAIMEMLVQMEASRKEDQKQMMAVAKEIKRVEAAICKMVEKSSKANSDALWARVQEDFAKQEKLARERQQQIANLITNTSNKELPVIVEKIIKKELAAVGQAVARAVTPVIEKTVSSAIADSFQRGVGDKAVNLLEKSVTSKLEATVTRQIQSQFQTSGKQAIQEALRTSMETTVAPAFDKSCKAMFEQVDATFQKGMIEHSAASQQQYDSTHSPLAVALRDVINSASSLTQTLTAELADGQRKLLALAVAGANSKAANPLITQLSNGPLGGLHDKIEAPLDPTKELSRLVSERKYDEAFTAALQRSEVSIVSWLCSQVDLHKILSGGSIPLSQGVLLSLLQQLACDITSDTSRKLGWMTDVAVAINPTDPVIAVHVRPIFEQVYQILNHHRSLPTASSADLSSVRLLMHVINSMLMGGK